MSATMAATLATRVYVRHFLTQIQTANTSSRYLNRECPTAIFERYQEIFTVLRTEILLKPVCEPLICICRGGQGR